MDSDLPFLQRDLASQVRRWIEWDRKDRDQQRIRTYGDTQIITLPVPMWPTHAQFEAWIETMEATATRIEALEAELAEKEAQTVAEIVAWLRERAWRPGSPAYPGTCTALADAIEQRAYK